MYTFVCADVSNPKLIIILFATHQVKQEKSNQNKQHGRVFQMSSERHPNPFQGVPSIKITISRLGKFGKSSTQISGGYVNSLEGTLNNLAFFSLLNL